MKKSDSARRAIKAAATASEVIAAIRGYLSSLDPPEIALLPESLMAVVLSETEEIVQAALHLVHGALLAARDPSEAELLGDANLVFAAAAKRLAALAKDVA